MKIYENAEGGVKISSFDNVEDLIISYEGQICQNFSTLLMDEISEYEPKDVTLILSSQGGDVTQISPFLSLCKLMRIKKICGMGQIYSAALAILIAASSRRIPCYIDETTSVIMHRPMTLANPEERSERMNGFIEDWPAKIEKKFDEFNKRLLTKLNKDKKNTYARGDNVYLIGEQLIEFGICKPFAEAFK
jgi:ATP-dependent protease ClpP protease subunit